MTDAVRTRAALTEAIEARDEDAFELALDGVFRDELVARALIDLLVQALALPWHHSHEDLLSVLQDLKDPRSVDAVFEAAQVQHEYLDYDEFFGLARKCTWALADIGTPEARGRLEQLAASPNQLVAGYARKRLDGWQGEIHRKGR
jgi:hypothetical protein